MGYCRVPRIFTTHDALFVAGLCIFTCSRELRLLMNLFRRSTPSISCGASSMIQETTTSTHKGRSSCLIIIVDSPDARFLQSYASSVILSLTYGKPSPTRKSEPDVGLITEYLYQLGQALLPGARLVEYVPWLKYVPFYARDLRKLHRDELALFQRHLKNTRIDIVRLNKQLVSTHSTLIHFGDSRIARVLHLHSENISSSPRLLWAFLLMSWPI